MDKSDETVAEDKDDDADDEEVEPDARKLSRVCMVASTRTVLFCVSLSGVCGREELLPLLVHREPLAELSKSLSSSCAPKRSRWVALPVGVPLLPNGEGDDVFLGRGE